MSVRPGFHRFALIWGLTSFSTEVSAQVTHEDVVSQLTHQGYSQIEISRTWLGRVRITAQGNNLDREIILNPSTGTILRDHWTPITDNAPGPDLLAVPPGETGEGRRGRPGKPDRPRPDRDHPEPDTADPDPDKTSMGG